MPIRVICLVITAAFSMLSLSCAMLPSIINNSETKETSGSPRFANQNCVDPEPNGGMKGEWPGSLSSEIPPLEDNIRTVFTTNAMVRIFYSKITAKQVNDYLYLLEQNGFTLKPIVYVREGFPDNSEEKIRKGDFDAIEARKGIIYIRIEFGCDRMDMVIENRE